MDEQKSRPRHTYLGGPDLAAVCGRNPYSGPFDVWLKKIEQLETEMTPPMEWGLRLESAIAMKWSEVTGHTIMPGYQVFHPEMDYLGGTPDFFCADDLSILLEVKTAAEEMLYQTDEQGFPLWGEEGTDQIPAGYLIQCQYYMGLTQRTRCEIPVFFLGPRREFRIYKVDFDPELYAKLIERGKSFWTAHVILGTEPPVDVLPSDAVLEYLAKKALAGSQTVEIPEEMDTHASALEEVSYQRLLLEEKEEALKAKMLNFMARNGLQKMKGRKLDCGYSIAIIGSDDDDGKPIIRWDWIAEELSKRLGYPEIPKTLVSEKTFNSKPKRPYIRGFFNAVRTARKKMNQEKEQKNENA